MTDGFYAPGAHTPKEKEAPSFHIRDLSVLNLEGLLTFSVEERQNNFSIEVKTPWQSTHKFSPTYVSQQAAMDVLKQYEAQLKSREYILNLTGPNTARIDKSPKYL